MTAIIPARLQSKRFPRKVLFPLKGKPLIYYVWKAATQSKLINQIFIATDSEEIGRTVNSFGGAVIMTSAKPKNGSERAAEAVREMKTNIVVNIQADNLGLKGSILDRVIREMIADRKINFATLARKIDGKDWKKKINNPDVVKTIMTADSHAGWFSRLPIPYIQRPGRKRSIDLYSFLEHIGVYFYRKQALMDYALWDRAMTEKVESLEQLRILENGGRIRLFTTRTNILSVDSKKVLEKIGNILK